MTDYVTIAGVVQFDPRQRTAGDKQVRDVAIRSIADQKMYNITLWPENENVPVNKGDFVVADGSYRPQHKQNAAGEAVTYHNVSANSFHNLTAGGGKPKAAKKEAAVTDTGDEFPF